MTLLSSMNFKSATKNTEVTEKGKCDLQDDAMLSVLCALCG